MKETDANAILKRIESIEKRLDQQKVLLTFDEACAYLKFSRAHLYRLCYMGNIPCHNPTGGTLFFYKHELEKWIEGKKTRRRFRKNK